MATYKVFVYGTLKRGEPNHQTFFSNPNGHCKFIDDAKTVEKYPLIIATKYNIPFMLHEPGVGHNVKGEVYEVDEKVLADLDVLEDYPKFYSREEFDVIFLSSSAKSKAWIYIIKSFKKILLQKEMLECYKNGSDQRYIYVPSEEATMEDLIKFENMLSDELSS